MTLPRGLTQFERQVTAVRDVVECGRMVCIDPATGATSGVGWAEYVDGVYVRGGQILTPKGACLAVRLRWIAAKCSVLGLTGADLCVVERLRGRMVHNSLHWSAGVLVTAVAKGPILEIPIPVWKAVAEADPAYAKGDEADARAMGEAVVRVVRGLPALHRAPKVPRRGRTVRGRADGSGGVRVPKHRAPGMVRKKPGRRGGRK